MNPYSHYPPHSYDHPASDLSSLPPQALSVLEQLQLAYQLISQALGRAPQLHDYHLDQALLLLVISMKKARRSPRLRTPPPWNSQQQFQFP